MKKISFFLRTEFACPEKHPFLCQMTVSYIDRGVRNFNYKGVGSSDTPIAAHKIQSLDIGVSKILTPLCQAKLYNTYNVRVCIGGV